jgi:hypothetical protein
MGMLLTFKYVYIYVYVYVLESYIVLMYGELF